MKKLISVLLTLTLVISAFTWLTPLSGAADSVSGKCGPGAKWSLNSTTGVLKIYGYGSTFDYTSESGYSIPWDRNSVKAIEVGNGIETLGKSIFSSCTDAETVILPGTLTAIKDNAFSYCSSLTEAVLPDSVTTLGSGAFRNCYGLKKAVLSSKLLKISGDTFSNCTALESVTVQEGILTVEAEAFFGCSSLKDVYYSSSEENFGKISIDYFGNTSLKNAQKHWFCFNIIDEIDVSGFVRPAAGMTASDTVKNLSVPAGANYSVYGIDWIDNSRRTAIPGSEKFEKNKSYTAVIIFSHSENYSFSEKAVIKINGSGELCSADESHILADRFCLYTVPLTAENLIDKIDIEGFAKPRINQTAAEASSGLAPVRGAGYSISAVYWFDSADSRKMDPGEKFRAGRYYYLSLLVTADADGKFTGGTEAYLNGSQFYVDTENSRYESAGQYRLFSRDIQPGTEIFKSAGIEGFEIPRAGTTAGESLRKIHVPGEASYYMDYIKWIEMPGWSVMDENDVFSAEKEYFLSVTLCCDKETGNLSAALALINGENTLIYSGSAICGTDSLSFVSVNIKPAADILYGDVNHDGDITNKDVLTLRRFLAGTVDETGISTEAADTDCDGEITNKDVLLLRRFLAGAVDSLGKQ